MFTCNQYKLIKDEKQNDAICVWPDQCGSCSIFFIGVWVCDLLELKVDYELLHGFQRNFIFVSVLIHLHLINLLPGPLNTL